MRLAIPTWILPRKAPRSGGGEDARAGFLLTETLATFTISAFVLLGLVSASSVLLGAVDRSVAHVQDVDALTRAMAAVRRDISGLARTRWNGVEPQAFVFRGGPNSLFFARRGGSPGGGESQVIALREIVGAAGPQLTRADAALPPLARSFDDLQFGPARELATGPARLRFFYVMGAGKGRPEQSRIRSWPSGDTLPIAIVVEAVEAASGRLIVSERVPVHANADVGCLPGGSNTPGVAPPTPRTFDGSQETSPFLAGANFKGPDGAQSSGFCGRADKDELTPGASPGAAPLGGPPQPGAL